MQIKTKLKTKKANTSGHQRYRDTRNTITLLSKPIQPAAPLLLPAEYIYKQLLIINIYNKTYLLNMFGSFAWKCNDIVGFTKLG